MCGGLGRRHTNLYFSMKHHNIDQTRYPHKVPVSIEVSQLRLEDEPVSAATSNVGRLDAFRIVTIGTADDKDDKSSSSNAILLLLLMMAMLSSVPIIV